MSIVAQRTGTTQVVAKRVIETALHEIINCDGITIINFGRFERKRQTFKGNLKTTQGKSVEVEKLVFRSKVRY